MGRFNYCLNTSTIRSKDATIFDTIDTAADAGYSGIEPWVQELDAWVKLEVRLMRCVTSQQKEI